MFMAQCKSCFSHDSKGGARFEGLSRFLNAPSKTPHALLQRQTMLTF